jgi:nucleoside diphosphate kinase
MERTLVIIKPEAVKKKLVGKIVTMYEDNRLEIVHSTESLQQKKFWQNTMPPILESLSIMIWSLICLLLMLSL